MFSKVRPALRRLFPYFTFHHILIIILGFAIIFQSILLSGCSSSTAAIRNIYIVSFKYSPEQNHTTENSDFRKVLATFVGQAQLEVRVGYFGLCVSDSRIVGWTCSNNVHDLKNPFNDTTDPLDLINNGSHFKDDIVFPYLVIVAIVVESMAIMVLETFPGWHPEEDANTGSEVDVKPFPSRSSSQLALSLSLVAVIFTLITALWQHFSASSAGTTIEFTVLNLVDASVGSVAAALVWISFLLVFVVVAGLISMIISIVILDRLTGG